VGPHPKVDWQPLAVGELTQAARPGPWLTAFSQLVFCPAAQWAG